MDRINEISLKLKLTRHMYTRVQKDLMNKITWFSHFPRVRILLEDKDDEVLLRGHEDLVTGGLEPQEGQGVGRVEVTDYRLGLLWSIMASDVTRIWY